MVPKLNTRPHWEDGDWECYVWKCTRSLNARLDETRPVFPEFQYDLSSNKWYNRSISVNGVVLNVSKF